jgi:hypothetical protein
VLALFALVDLNAVGAGGLLPACDLYTVIATNLHGGEEEREQKRVEGEEQMGTVRERDETRCSVLLQI